MLAPFNMYLSPRPGYAQTMPTDFGRKRQAAALLYWMKTVTLCPRAMTSSEETSSRKIVLSSDGRRRRRPGARCRFGTCRCQEIGADGLAGSRTPLYKEVLQRALTGQPVAR